MRRHLSVSLLVLALGGFPCLAPLLAGDAPVSTPSASGWTMSAADREALDAVVERAIAAGVPDARGGTFLHGKLSYETVFHDGNSTYRTGHVADGLHLRLADGRLLLNLLWLVPTTGDGAVDTSGLQEVAPDKLNELGMKHAFYKRWGPFNSERDSSLEKIFAEAELPKVRAACAPTHDGLLALALGNHWSLGLDVDLTIPAIILLRMQVPGAEEVALTCAMYSLWNEDGNAFFEGRAVPLTLLDEEAEMFENDKRLMARRNLTFPDPARILRQGVLQHFTEFFKDRNQYLRSWNARPWNAVVPTPDQAEVAALQMLNPDDPGESAVRAELARLVEWAALPQDIEIEADLTGPENEGDSDEQTEKAEINDLMALVSDGGISRWLDQNRVRTVGDNALRELTMRMGVDPRRLIGRDPKAPWTTEERSATTTALTTWWATNRDKPFVEMKQGVIGVLSLPELANLLTNSSDTDRAVLLAEIAKHWAIQAPKDPEPTALGAILHAAKESKVLDAVVSPWPVSGRQRALLAVWHLENGNPAHVDALIADVAKLGKSPAQSGADDDEEGDDPFVENPLVEVLRIATRHPTPDRLTRLMALITTPPAGDDGSLIATSVSRVTTSSWNDALRAWWGEGDKPEQEKRANAAVPLVLFGLLLKDQRPAAKQLVKESFWYAEDTAEPFAVDLRLADTAAAAFPIRFQSLGIDDLAGKEAAEDLHAMKLDLSADRATRDHIITTQLAIIATALPLALKAANLPTAIPGLTLAPAADASDF